MSFAPIGRTFDEFGAMKPDDRLRLGAEFHRANRNYLDNLLGKCSWIVVLCSSGTVYSSGEAPPYPNSESLLEIAKKTGEIPFAYSRQGA